MLLAVRENLLAGLGVVAGHAEAGTLHVPAGPHACPPVAGGHLTLGLLRLVDAELVSRGEGSVLVPAWHAFPPRGCRDHDRYDEQCWHCGRLRARSCTSKRRFEDPVSAEEHARRVERASPAGGVCAPYRCRFCKGYHVGTAKGQKLRSVRRRREKQRRKALWRTV